MHIPSPFTQWGAVRFPHNLKHFHLLNYNVTRPNNDVVITWLYRYSWKSPISRGYSATTRVTRRTVWARRISTLTFAKQVGVECWLYHYNHRHRCYHLSYLLFRKQAAIQLSVSEPLRSVKGGVRSNSSYPSDLKAVLSHDICHCCFSLAAFFHKHNLITPKPLPHSSLPPHMVTQTRGSINIITTECGRLF